VHIESLSLTNFQCFGPDTVRIPFEPGLTALVGVNGAGKTAALQGLMRLFGVTEDQRRVRVQDFHVPVSETPDTTPASRTLTVEVILVFPELVDESDDADAVPEFFQQMAAEDSGTLKCRLRLDAEWTDDGSVDGAVNPERKVVRSLAAEFGDDEWSPLKPVDRARIQMIYVPAARDGARHLTSFLKGRLWRAAIWSPDLRDQLESAADDLNTKFGAEPVVKTVETALTGRWQQLHTAGTDATPSFRPVDAEVSVFVGKADLMFQPTETGHDRRADQLSDGQRSLLHIALTAATLDVEAAVAGGHKDSEFDPQKLVLPTLTILAVEEPENSLAPFFLTRIVTQMLEVAAGNRAQAVLSSHSASVLGRVQPTSVRHFRLDRPTLTSRVAGITLPPDTDEAAKYVREAVRKYPEMYFARFVVLGEGSSEEVALPILAEAAGVPIDQSFVSVVPLGGRHVHHLWTLLTALHIPYVTLLDLDRGRHGGGVGRIKTVHHELGQLGVTPCAAGDDPDDWDIEQIEDEDIGMWVRLLRSYGVYFCDPLDLDWTLLNSFHAQYTTLEAGMRGPDARSDPTDAVLGAGGSAALYTGQEDRLRWYRYLFLGRAKPSTHLRVLSGLTEDELRAGTPDVLAALIERVRVDVT